GLPKNLHGAQVGVGTIIMLHAYQYLREVNPTRIDPQKVLRNRPSLEAIEAENQKLYGDKADAFNKVARKKRIPDGDYVAYLRSILDRWDEIWTELEPYVAPVERIQKPFDQAGVPYSLESVRRTRAEARE